MCTGSKTYHLFKSQKSRDLQLQFKLKKCLPLLIEENDSLPKGICKNCIKKIEEFYEFINQCVSTESVLKSFCMTSSVSDQSECQEKLVTGQSFGGNYNDKIASPKKNDNSDHALSILTTQNLSNPVQTDSTQIVKDINDRYQDVCKYPVRYETHPLTNSTNKVKSIKHNYRVTNNLISKFPTD